MQIPIFILNNEINWTNFTSLQDLIKEGSFNTLLVISVFAILFVAVFVDVKTGKIPNSFNGFALSCGLIYRVVLGDVTGVWEGLLGVIIPILGLIVLFAFGVVGAGDIKLLAGIGEFWWQNCRGTYFWRYYYRCISGY